MSALLLDAKILGLTGALEEAGIPHAFGGAIALAYCGVPRGTEDIDLNLFLSHAKEEDCLEALAPLGVDARPHNGPPHQSHWHWNPTPIHAFFAYDPFHESCRSRVRRVAFADHEIPVLSAEDIALFKILYDRPKDRNEVREVLLCMGERFDVDYATHWLERLIGLHDERAIRFLASAAELCPSAR